MLTALQPALQCNNDTETNHRSRLYLPTRSPVPINLTIFKRAQGGALGEQLVTTGPYSDSICGVSTGKMKLDSGGVSVSSLEL